MSLVAAQVRLARMLGMHRAPRAGGGRFRAGHSGNPGGHRRGVVPRPLPPTAIVREYQRALLAVVARFRAALAPLLEQLPSILESARRERQDAGEAERVRALVARARAAVAGSVTQRDVEDLARTFAQRTAAHQRLQMQRQVRAVLGIDVALADPKVGGMMQHFAHESAALITNAGAKMVSDVESMTLEAVRRGRLASDLADDIEDKLGVAEDRARFIARDQIGKLNADVDQARQRELGVTRFTWRTMHDERVRGDPSGLYPKARTSHYDFDGKVYSYSDPPLDADGDPILPGDDYNCRCFAEPVLDDLLGDEE